VIYRGRYLDPLALWANYIDFPGNFKDDGTEFSSIVMCPNPDHDARRPHFQINMRRPLVHCFSNCGISGTYEKAISIIEGCNEREARKIILKHCQIPNNESAGESAKGGRKGTGRRSDKNGATSEARAFSLAYSTYIPQTGAEYLHRRGIAANSLAVWSLGWDQADRRIVIPADDDRGITRFLIKRAVTERQWPKYLYYPEREQCGWGKQDILFGACHLTQGDVRSYGLVLMEGSIDTIHWHQEVHRNAVGILGSSLSERQAQIISKLNPPKIICLFDKDASGFKALRSAYEKLCKYPIFVGLYPKGKSDPAELSGKEGRRVIENAVSVVSFNSRLPRNLKLERKVAYG